VGKYRWRISRFAAAMFENHVPLDCQGDTEKNNGYSWQGSRQYQSKTAER
jgi:hypothetical protein